MARLLMIYNADGGLVNGALDLLHKMVSPATYACRLCDITYGPLGMKRDWRATIEALSLPVTFLHRDEWLAARPLDGTPLPAILRDADGTLTTLVSAADFQGLATLDELKTLLQDRLSSPPSLGHQGQGADRKGDPDQLPNRQPLAEQKITHR